MGLWDHVVSLEGQSVIQDQGQLVVVLFNTWKMGLTFSAVFCFICCLMYKKQLLRVSTFDCIRLTGLIKKKLI